MLSYIVTKEKPKGDKNLVRVSWKLKNMPFDTLIQFVGYETLSVELIHGNSKQNKQPRVLMKTSLKAHIASSPMKASALTEQLVLVAGTDKISQLLNTPNNHRQVRQLQSNLRKREEQVDIYTELLRLSYELPYMRLLTFAPRLLMVSNHHHHQLHNHNHHHHHHHHRHSADTRGRVRGAPHTTASTRRAYCRGRPSRPWSPGTRRPARSWSRA